MGRIVAPYASPEALGNAPNGRNIVTTKSDMWSIGCLLLELLSDEGCFSREEDTPADYWPASRQRQQTWVLLCAVHCCPAYQPKARLPVRWLAYLSALGCICSAAVACQHASVQQKAHGPVTNSLPLVRHAHHT